jgi:alkanesulfonate monooxygenase SsuD/methylene tetrahydromethanopterin reductase-like flavin-dependent oxidoreductase (luciferase family)
MAAEERSKANLEGAPVVAVLQNAFVTENPEDDWPRVRAGVAHQMGVYAGWGAGTDVAGRPLEIKPPDERSLRAMTAYGTPDEVAEQLDPLAATLGEYPESHLIVRLHYPGMEALPARRAMSLFAREVVPRLRERAAGPSGR